MMTLPFFVSVGLFVVGILLIVTKKNAIFALMGIELILNAANLNFIVFSKQWQGLEGEMMVIFSIVLAAAEAAVALSLVILLIKKYKSSDLDVPEELKY